MLDNICYWQAEYPDCSCIIGGDFNIDLDLPSSSSSRVTSIIKTFLSDGKLCRCDQFFTSHVSYTYFNEPLNHYTKLDYFVSDGVSIKNFEILDPDVNFSDHLP